MALQTPGQTPDSLALYDERESWVFVGDTLYQRIAEMPWGEMHELPIILVAQRHWGDFVGSLLDFVTQKKTGKGLRLSSGHSTPG